MSWLRWAVACLVCAGVLVGARPVRAAETQSQQGVTEGGYKTPYRVESQTKPRTKIWYGYQTLAADAVAVGMMLAADPYDSRTLTVLGIGTYLLGAPLVHLAHGGEATLPSFLLRLAPPAILAVGAAGCAGLGASVAESEHINPLHLVALGFSCGMAALGVLAFPAVVVMDALLGYEHVEPPTSARAQSLVFPFYDPKRRAGMVSWAGTF